MPSRRPRSTIFLEGLSVGQVHQSLGRDLTPPESEMQGEKHGNAHGNPLADVLNSQACRLPTWLTGNELGVRVTATLI